MPAWGLCVVCSVLDADILDFIEGEREFPLRDVHFTAPACQPVKLGSPLN